MTQNNKNTLRILIDGTLPWDKQEGENRRLYGIVIILLILALFLMIVVESVTIEKPDRREQQKIPERLAQLVMEKKRNHHRLNQSLSPNRSQKKNRMNRSRKSRNRNPNLSQNRSHGLTPRHNSVSRPGNRPCQAGRRSRRLPCRAG